MRIGILKILFDFCVSHNSHKQVSRVISGILYVWYILCFTQTHYIEKEEKSYMYVPLKSTHFKKIKCYFIRYNHFKNLMNDSPNDLQFKLFVIRFLHALNMANIWFPKIVTSVSSSF